MRSLTMRSLQLPKNPKPRSKKSAGWSSSDINYDDKYGNDDDHESKGDDGHIHPGVGCPAVEQESVEQPLVSKNVGGGRVTS